MRNAPTSPLTRPLAGAVLLALALAACSSGPRQAGSGDTASPAHGQPAADSLTAEVPAPAPSPVPTRAESERGSAAADASRQRQQRMAAAVACGCSMGNRWLPSSIMVRPWVMRCVMAMPT